ncbi:hypothetical protein SRHO_G00139910 [Serrasalmus rhombeus]
MCRLMGRARDVVRIGLRSDPTLVARENPDVIYNILLQYFSKTSSCLPLADFYSTLPRQKENPVDYWIRVNKAADLAVEGLHRQGRGMENMTEEITRMFIKHCPDPELAYMFKCKPIHEWNAKQIQERIDEYQREKRPITCVSNAAHLCHKATVTHVEDSDATLNGRIVAKSSNYANNTGESNVVMSQQYSSQDDAMLNRMMTMLEQVLEKVQRKDAETSHLHEGRRRSWRKNNMMVCSVCVVVGNKVSLNAMLDSGSMACTLSEAAELKLIDAGAANETSRTDTDVILIGCGGSRVKPKCTIELNMEIYGCSISVPALVVRGQSDDLIIGTNVIKHILHQLKRDSQYWKVISAPTSNCQESEQFLSLLAGLNRWTNGDVPDKVGTARCNTAVTVDAGTEYLLWAKLPGKAVVSPGSTVIVEPTSSHAAPRGLMIARIVTPLWGDGWIPLKVLNASSRPITIRRNAKLADVFTCLALEDMGGSEGPLCSKVQITDCGQTVSKGSDISRSHENSRIEVKEALKLVGLSDLDLEACDVSETWKEKLADLVLKYEDIFSHHHLDCGEAKGFVHRIHLVDDKPFRLPFRRVPPAEYQKLKRVLDEMEEREIIRKSTSEYASPLVLVWKKNGDLRVCTDFRWLNKRTLKDAHPLPHQADCLAALGGNALFSTMDLTSGFYNMPLHEDDRKYSAFTTPMGLYEYNRLPQGLCNSPGSFMRMMTSIFGDQNFLSLLCYLDDLLVYAPTEALALERLELVFSRLRLHNLKLAPKKCWFLRRSVKFLGHVVDESGVSTDPSKVDAISQMCTNDLMELDGVTPSPSRIRSFLGMINFYQHFIPSYSATAKPLFGLVAGQKQKRKGRPHAKVRTQLRKLSPRDWTSAHQEAFDALKLSLLNCAVLAHPDFTRPFILSTDASQDGLGAVLSQVQEGESRARPIAFASKSLTQAQKRYPAHRLEFLALKWAVCDKFSHWLKGHVFTVWTDNNPLTHIMTKPKLDSCEQRWVAKLASFEFDIKYIPGPRNIVADALSRKPFVRPIIGQRILKVPYDELLRQTVPVSTNSVQDAFRCSGCPVDDVTCLVGEKEWTPTCTENHSLSREVVSAVLETHSVWDSGARARATGLLHHLPQMVSSDADIIPYSERELREAQLTDPVLSRVLHYVDRGRRPSRREKAREPVMVLRYLKQWEKLVSCSGILYRVCKDQISKKKRHQFIVPDSFKQEVLKGVHDCAGHQGQFRTLAIARQRFFWPHIDRDVRDYVRHCPRCVIGKSADPDGRAPLESIKTTSPLEIVCIDFWCAENRDNSSVNVLVVTDHFTRLSHAFPCKDQSAKQVAKQLWDKYFCIYGFPERIHSDQGASFESQLISELLEVAGVRKSHTTPYHPMGNGSVERFNRTLGNMIRALTPDAKRSWPQQLQSLTFMYNCTVHETTGYPPFFLMFGRVPRLPIDLMFKNILKDPEVSSYDSYVISLTKDLKDAMVIAQQHADKEQHRQEQNYNRRVKGSQITVGDRVLVANKRERGKRKTADRWESTVYTVVSVNGSTHTYRIRSPVTGQERVVHRNLLMLVNFLPLDLEAASDASFAASQSASSHDVSDVDGGLPISDIADDAHTRVQDWVSGLPCSEVNVASTEGVEAVSTVRSSVPCPTHREQSGNVDQSSDDTRSESATSGNLVHVHANDCPTSTVNLSSIHDVRSRVGRLVKPVDRLIYTMSKQVTDRNSYKTINKVARPRKPGNFIFSRTVPLKLPCSCSRAAHRQASVKLELRAEGRSSSDGAETPSGSDQLPQGHGLCTRPGLQPKLADKTR